ncbi:hypothetical protein V8G54_033022 [Vigna mungo]|uniref:Uncharacterized protein n=1 Tax=Vigna mungo TaxID=3915 RepID=A0AAQ3MNJ6_VIGMU
MASFCAARTFHIPPINGGVFCRRASWAAGIGGATVAGVSLLRSCSSKRTLPFACRSISNDSRIKEAVQTEKAPAALGPYSQAIKANNLLFVSGVLGLVPETGKFISDNVEDQTEQDFKKVNEIYAKCEFYASDLMLPYQDHHSKLLHINYFPSPAPARSTYQVAALPMDAKIEIECIAAL